MVIRTRREVSSPNEDPFRMNSETDPPTKVLAGEGDGGERVEILTKSV